MSPIEKRLKASVGVGAVHGSSMERSVCSSQMMEAANCIDDLRAENARLREIAEKNEAAADALWADNARLRDALKECEIEIDNYIDADYPPGVHPMYRRKNAMYKAHNPARLALEAKDD